MGARFFVKEGIIYLFKKISCNGIYTYYLRKGLGYV